MCMFVWTFFLLCRLSASCHSWTTHGHICQCHEVEPFPARAGNLFHFPWVFLAPFSFLFSFFSVESLWKCATPKNAITFFFFSKRLLLRCRWQHTDMNVCLVFFFFFTETGVGSLHALRSRTRSVPGVGPATRHGQLLWGSYRWGFPRDWDWKLGWRFYWRARKRKKGKKKKELHFEWTKYVNLFPKRIDLHILKTNAVSPLLQTQHRN